MPSIGTSAIVHLLDSAQGQPLQTWRFANRTTISIGRSDDNDIVVANPLVSRAHATLVYDGSGWTLVSTGRHGTIVDSRVAAEFPLRHQMIFQLGAGGPMLRFDAEAGSPRHSETLESISPETFAMLEVDEHRKQAEVDAIAGNDLFRNLLEQSRQLRNRPQSPPEPNGVDPDTAIL